MRLIVPLTMCMDCGTIFEKEHPGYCMEPNPTRNGRRCYDGLVSHVELHLDMPESMLTCLHHFGMAKILSGKITEDRWDHPEAEWEPQQRRFAGSLTPRDDPDSRVLHIQP